jgi:uncharacterized protein DUF5676
MDKRNPLGTGIGLAVTFAFLSILCAIAFAVAPDATINFFGAFMHGLDLNSVRSTAPLSLGRVLYGVIGLAIIGFIAGLVFAWTYNAVSRK